VIADHEGLRFATRVGLTPLIGMSYVMIHTSPVQKIIILIMMAGLVVSLYRMRRRSVAARV
jgi:phosphate starvation-inducible membrane PsiE